ncbi:PhoH family protein, partial [Pseudomonas syringae pv. tagetis]|uniref:PhoH family protein n=1 Tax=Pseudomonas syringae group genomosp. 7 TaxID=251699 RepID=UPI00376FD871
ADGFVHHPAAEGGGTLPTKNRTIRPRGLNHQLYVMDVLTNDINFGIGPARTGKTYLTVACAEDAREGEQVRLLVLVRRAVAAGDRRG